MHEQETYTTPVLYFLIGGLVGAGAALLLAPQSGKETRDQLGQKFRDGAEGARQLKDNLAQKTEQVKQGAARLKDRAMTAFSGVNSTAEELS
jgi:gas vesicle protein